MAKKHNLAVFLLGIALGLPYWAGTVWPDQWWGTHHVAFLPSPWKYLVLGLAVFLIALPAILPRSILLLFPKKRSRYTVPGLVMVAGLLMGLAYYHFPIVNDVYGNARNLLPVIDHHITSLPQDFLDKLGTFKFEPGHGRKGVLQIITLLAWLFDLSYAETFKWVDAVFGAAFVMVWLLAVTRFLKNRTWIILLSIIGISAPGTFNFFGHFEAYAPVLFFLLLWSLCLKVQIQRKSGWLLWSLLIVLPLGVRMHTFMLLLLPAWLLALLHQYEAHWPGIRQLWSWKKMLGLVIGPLFLSGAVLYFFVYGDYNDPRTLDEGTFRDIDRLFLPLVPPAPPLDHYHLLSWNHLFDYGNVLLLWSSSSIFLLLVLILSYRKQIKWQNATSWLHFINLLLLGVILFMINPLLSMPMDWDLMMLPFPILLVWLLHLVSQVEEQPIPKVMVGLVLSLSLWGLPLFWVNHLEEPHAQRLESVAIHIYHGYYEHTDTYLNYAWEPLHLPPEGKAARLQTVIQKLQPFARPKIDKEFAGLVKVDGLYYLKQRQQFQVAKTRFEEALYYYPLDPNVYTYLIEACYSLQDYPAAYQYAVQLIALEKAPEKIQRAHRMAIHCALRANYYDQALAHCQAYLQLNPQDEFIQTIRQRLQNGDRVEELISMFAHG